MSRHLRHISGLISSDITEKTSLLSFFSLTEHYFAKLSFHSKCRHNFNQIQNARNFSWNTIWVAIMKWNVFFPGNWYFLPFQTLSKFCYKYLLRYDFNVNKSRSHESWTMNYKTECDVLWITGKLNSAN